MRDGAEYLQALADGRYVTLDGAEVADVTKHPALRPGARSVARMLDLHVEPDGADVMTTVDDSGRRISRAYALAGSASEVAARGRCFERIARLSGGLMGRSPDFLATLIACWSAAADVFGAAGPRVRAYHEYASSRLLCLTHAISDPPRDRFGTSGGEPLTLRKVGETGEGIVVRGMKMLATLAPIADDLLIYPFRPLGPGEGDRALAFAVPISTPGLRLLCRPGIAAGAPAFDRPLAERFDEMDALCVFEDVVVPWDRVFIDGDVELANTLRPRTGMTSYLWHQTTIRSAVKAELVFGTASLLTRLSSRDSDPSVQQKLGEMAALVEALRSLVTAAEAGASVDRFGWYTPSWAPLGASGVLGSEFFARLIELLQLVGSSGLIMRPTLGDLGSAYADDLVDYFTGADVAAQEHVAVLNLAADLAVSDFAGRQLLYERFYLGQPDALKQRYLAGVDRERAEALARGLLVPGRSSD